MHKLNTLFSTSHTISTGITAAAFEFWASLGVVALGYRNYYIAQRKLKITENKFTKPPPSALRFITSPQLFAQYHSKPNPYAIANPRDAIYTIVEGAFNAVCQQFKEVIFLARLLRRGWCLGLNKASRFCIKTCMGTGALVTRDNGVLPRYGGCRIRRGGFD
ncbi:uncharacterized protein PgNI_08024 [Pyricularia grisea]|uniref:Uncharacterized protein n=1 Tax=Pyricularia grisea TaxID=148305 RepID=A0A6P8AWI8_PYRGI|nr:uncharacterized protein PgNI_08024 [Pyricularia grisea]TLD06565.1 hypothetical protein PgNI_08024 [Pyricularia grisea]